ncbi:hypothetical protein [Methylobacter svalbardensis]|uniref:hypothetical protein n=1 Tax=Methylobacter svalbardensis TaxID=3080016 RepID=UPI0030ED9E51
MRLKFFCFHCTEKSRLPNLLRIHRMAIQLGIYRRSFRVAFIVGTVLNLIHQPQALLGSLFLDFHGDEHLNITKTLLTYAVPFLVATYGALTAINPRLIDSQNKPSA